MTWAPGAGPRTVGELLAALQQLDPALPVLALDGWDGVCWLDPLMVTAGGVGIGGRVEARDAGALLFCEEAGL